MVAVLRVLAESQSIDIFFTQSLLNSIEVLTLILFHPAAIDGEETVCIIQGLTLKSYSGW